MAEAPEPLDVTLADGTRVHLRPIEPGDKAALQEGLQRLSPMSRYRRFHSAVNHLTDKQLSYLTEIDYEDHMAWVAVDPDAPGEIGMGVARYIRLEGEPTVAEVAVTVVDDYQGRGVGSLLLGVLSRTAIEHGIRTLRNYVLADNDAMLALLDDLGATREPEGEGVYRVDMPLPQDPRDLPETPAMRVLEAAAQRRLPPFCQLFGKLGPPWGDRDDDAETSWQRDERQR